MSDAGDDRDRDPDRPPDERDTDVETEEPRGRADREPIRETPHESDDRQSHYTDEDSRLTDRLAVLISAIVGLVVTGLAYWWAQGQNIFHENLYRVQPTIENRGVGSDWVAGNTDPALDAMIAIIHAADVIMGIAILFMVFLHWAAFRRLASRMRQPGETRRADAVATDGGAETESRENGGDDR